MNHIIWIYSVCKFNHIIIFSFGCLSIKLRLILAHRCMGLSGHWLCTYDIRYHFSCLVSTPVSVYIPAHYVCFEWPVFIWNSVDHTGCIF